MSRLCIYQHHTVKATRQTFDAGKDFNYTYQRAAKCDKQRGKWVTERDRLFLESQEKVFKDLLHSPDRSFMSNWGDEIRLEMMNTRP